MLGMTFKLTFKLLVLVFALVAVCGTMVLARARARARKQKDHGGCIACGSTLVVRTAHSRVCQACGYVGARDGGGKLSDAEIRAAFPDGNGPDWR